MSTPLKVASSPRKPLVKLAKPSYDPLLQRKLVPGMLEYYLKDGRDVLSAHIQEVYYKTS
jgi:hypothetical protein